MSEQAPPYRPRRPARPAGPTPEQVREACALLHAVLDGRGEGVMRLRGEGVTFLIRHEQDKRTV